MIPSSYYYTSFDLAICGCFLMFETVISCWYVTLDFSALNWHGSNGECLTRNEHGARVTKEDVYIACKIKGKTCISSWSIWFKRFSHYRGQRGFVAALCNLAFIGIAEVLVNKMLHVYQWKYGICLVWLNLLKGAVQSPDSTLYQLIVNWCIHFR